MPLPAGVFRVYQKDEDNLEFIGEDRIEHTPRNSDVRITMGNAFDLTGERNVVERQKISDRSERDKIEIELTNHNNVPLQLDYPAIRMIDPYSSKAKGRNLNRNSRLLNTIHSPLLDGPEGLN